MRQGSEGKILMKIKDVKPTGHKDRTVGDLIEFLSQFPKDTPLIMKAESDACQENGHPFFYAHAAFSTWEEWETKTLPDGVEEGDMDVASVVITVDH
jgi:hypothetical protein